MAGKGIGTPDNKELVFKVYREFGGKNVPRIIEEANRRHGLSITAPTLYAWKNEGGWDGRIERADAARLELGEEGLSFEEKMFKALLERKRAYDEYFKTKHIDNQAQYAYNAVVESLIKLARNVKPEESRDPEEARRNIEEVFEAEYGIARNN